MLAVVLEIRALPHQTVAARGRSICPDVGTPQHYRSQLFGVAERSDTRIHRLAAHLIDLRFDRPLHRETLFVRIGLRIPPRVHVSAVAATAEKDQLEIGIPYFECAHYRSEIAEESVRI